MASIKAVHAVRADRFGTALEQWRAAGEIRAFCAALDEAAAASEDALEAERLREWSAWGNAEADRLDPTLSGKGLAAHNFHAEPTGDQLRPFLDGWHPHRPEKEKKPASAANAAQAGAGPVARLHRRTSGSRLEIWTPRSRSMVEAMTPCPRSRRALTAFSTSSPSRMTSARRATNSS